MACVPILARSGAGSPWSLSADLYLHFIVMLETIHMILFLKIFRFFDKGNKKTFFLYTFTCPEHSKHSKCPWNKPVLKFHSMHKLSISN